MGAMEPGLFISSMVPAGTAYKMDLSALMIVAPGGTKQGIAINPTDWDRISPEQQEAIRELMVRRSVDDGFDALSRFLTDRPNPGAGE
jgi:hypothetical protein